MQITLEVTGSQLDQEVKQLLEALTPEQKSELAGQMLQKSLDNTNSELMRQTAIATIVEEYNAGKDDYCKVQYRNGHWCDFRNANSSPNYGIRDQLDKLLKERTQASDYFRKDVMGAMIELAKKEVTKAVFEDPTIKEAVAQAVEEIKKEFPKIVHDAMTVYFCSQMQEMGKTLAASMFQTSNNDRLLTEIQEKLANKGIY